MAGLEPTAARVARAFQGLEVQPVCLALRASLGPRACRALTVRRACQVCQGLLVSLGQRESLRRWPALLALLAALACVVLKDCRGPKGRRVRKGQP